MHIFPFYPLIHRTYYYDDIFYVLKIYYYSNIGSVDMWISEQISKGTSKQVNNVAFSYPQTLLIRRNK